MTCDTLYVYLLELVYPHKFEVERNRRWYRDKSDRMCDCVLYVTQRKQSVLAHAHWTAASLRCAPARRLPVARLTWGPDVMPAQWSTLSTPAQRARVGLRLPLKHHFWSYTV